MIDDTDDTAPPSRVATPASAEKDAKAGGSGKDAGKPASDAPANGDNGEASQSGTEQTANAPLAAPPASSELPPEVRARLRKLEKLEKTYPGSRTPSY